MDTPSGDLVGVARQLVATLNSYEAHRLEAINDPQSDLRIGAHDDMRACSDANSHDPFRDVVERWPGYSARAKARRGELQGTSRRDLVAGAEVAVLSDGRREVVVRYIATDRRWVLDEALLASS